MTAAIATGSEPTPTAATPSAPTRDQADVHQGAGSGGLAPSVPGVRRPHLAPVPDSEPPFDDELDRDGARAVHGPRPVTATVEFVTAATALLESAPESAIRRPATIGAAGVPSWSAEADIGIIRTTTADLPPVQRAASMLARAVIEVLAGHRPVTQLRVHCAPAIYAGFGNRPAMTARALPHLLSVRVCEPADGIAEVSAVYRRADRVRALAFRLQGVDGRWRMTALQMA